MKEEKETGKLVFGAIDGGTGSKFRKKRLEEIRRVLGSEAARTANAYLEGGLKKDENKVIVRGNV